VYACVYECEYVYVCVCAFLHVCVNAFCGQCNRLGNVSVYVCVYAG